MTEKVVVKCSDCGWVKEYTKNNSFMGARKQSAQKAAQGHSTGGCSYDAIDIDVMPVK